MLHTVRRSLLFAFAALSVLSLSAACGSGPTKSPAPDVWAAVDDHEIHQDEVLKTYRREAQTPPSSSTDDETTMAQLGVVDELITRQVLLARARALNLNLTDAELDTAYNGRKTNLSDQQFQQALRERNLTPDDLRQGLRDDLLAQKVLDQEVGSKVQVTDAEVADFFAAHRAQFNVAETQYHLAQIVITPVRDPEIRNRKNDDATTPEEAKRKAQMLMDKLKAGGDFAQLAMDYSEDPQSAPQGGDLGLVSTSDLNRVTPELRDVVLKTEPGRVSTVSAGGAVTIVAVLERAAPGQRELSSPGVRENISNSLRDRKQQLLHAAYVTTLRNHAKIVNYLAQRIVDAHAKPPALLPGGPGK